jgi:gamma-glutamyltranspeptidase
MTLTLGSHCGTGNYSPLGFFYNNEMRNFTSLVARYPENYPPDSGPISSKAPLMVKKDGELFFILGGAGSDRIIFNNGLIIAALLSQKTTAYKAINSPRYFLDYKDVLQLEWRKNSRLTNELKRFRPESKIRQSGADYFGMVTFIGKSNEGFLAVSDFRRDASCTAIGQH